jgi:hypothetical protein
MDERQEYEQNKVEEELHDLKKELANFEKEKERVRAIVGQIGGVPKTQARFVNGLFIAIVAISVVISILAPEEWRLILIEVATVTLSIKIIYLMHAQMRMGHFEFWILSSLEWRVNEVVKQMRQLRKDLDQT